MSMTHFCYYVSDFSFRQAAAGCHIKVETFSPLQVVSSIQYRFILL